MPVRHRIKMDERAKKSLDADSETAIVEASMKIYRSRLATPPSVDELARLLGTTRALLAKIFRDRVGTTPARYGRTARMHWASAAIRDGTSTMADIADRTGYANPAAFSRAFRACFGHPPSEHVRVRGDRPACRPHRRHRSPAE